jgi:arginine-tRNA-protein transferase
MFTEIHFPIEILPKELDNYLAKGWFRMGQMIFTCHVLCFKDQVYSTVWIRLVLEKYAFQKSMRKLLLKNSNRFKTIIREAVFDSEKQKLYEGHKERFEGYIPNTLKESLFGMEEENLYNTYEVCVYENEELIAVSFFDIGSDSIASIMGLYNPDYAQYSLGIYTMLCEIQFGMEEGKKFYYPGYVVPGYKKFDYKLRVGQMDFYDVPSEEWKSINALKEELLPAETMRRMLSALKEALTEKQIISRLLIYPFYDKDLFGYEEKEFLQSPLILNIQITKNAKNELFFVEIDLVKKEYRLCKGGKVFNMLPVLMSSFLESFDKQKSFLDFILIEKTLSVNSSVAEIADAIEFYNNHPISE